MKILIVKIAAIGDVVMALPLLNSLRRKHPNAKISWICGKKVSSLIEATKLVDEIIDIDEKQLLKGSFFLKIAALLSIWKKIALKKFDLAFLLHSDFRYKAIYWPILCKSRKTWKNSSHPIPGHYHAIEALALLQKHEGPWTADLQFPTLHLPSVKAKVDILIAPGGAKNTLADNPQRRWPIKHYADLIKLLNKHSNLTVGVIGSFEDSWVIPFLQGAVFENLIGKFNLLELISCLKNSRVFITHDTGPLHLAKLAHCPTLSLFGPTNPSEKVTTQEGIEVFWGGENLACRPCYNGKSFAPCTNNLCLASILPETIYHTILQKLKK